MIHPLYLEAGHDWQIQLDDGVALRISAPGRARSLYPLRRLSRVVSPAAATWATDALLACLQAGITIVFHDRHGDPIAWCFGPRKRETTLGELLRETLARNDGLALLEAWRTTAEHNLILATLREANLRLRTISPAAARAALCNRHRQRVGQPVGPILRQFERATAALIAQRLYEQIGDPGLLGFAREGLHLPRLLESPMQWPGHGALLRAPINLLLGPTPGRAAAACVEHQGSALHRALGALLGELERHLRDLLT